MLLISFILSLPAIFYFYYIFLNSNFSNTVINYSQINFYSNSLIILSILLFYLFPFIFLQRSPFLTYLRENKKFIIIIFLIFLILYLIDQFLNFNLINFSPKGGGVFVKIANIFNINQLLVLSITSYLSLITLDYFFKGKRLQNYSLLIFLIVSFPIYTIYQKYFDPLFFLFFFGLIKSDTFKLIFLKGKNLIFLSFIYFSFFFLFSLIYYSKGFS